MTNKEKAQHYNDYIAKYGYTKWANKYNTKWVTYKGETKPLHQWCHELGIDYTRTNLRLSRGWSPEKSFELPAQRQKKNFPKCDLSPKYFKKLNSAE